MAVSSVSLNFEMIQEIPREDPENIQITQDFLDYLAPAARCRKGVEGALILYPLKKRLISNRHRTCSGCVLGLCKNIS